MGAKSKSKSRSTSKRRDSHSEADSDELSELSQKFEPAEGDEEVLYSVIEITGEKGKRFKVRWEGIDPKTNRPWLQSWVDKSDCTDDLVLAWKKKQRATSFGWPGDRSRRV